MSEPTSALQPLIAFVAQLKKAREKEGVLAELLQWGTDAVDPSPQFTQKLLSRLDGLSPDKWPQLDKAGDELREMIEELDDQVKAVLGLGKHEGKQRPVGEAIAVGYQADQLDRVQRAKLLRNSSYARRRFHAAARRRSHASQDGLMDKRVDGYVASLIKKANS